MGIIDEVESSSLWYISLRIQNENIWFKIDTGAVVTLIPEDIFLKMEKFPLQNTAKRLFGPRQKRLNVVGKFTDSISSDSKSVQEDIFVVRGLTRCLLVTNNRKIGVSKTCE